MQITKDKITCDCMWKAVIHIHIIIYIYSRPYMLYKRNQMVSNSKRIANRIYYFVYHTLNIMKQLL